MNIDKPVEYTEEVTSLDDVSTKGWAALCKMLGMKRSMAFRKREELERAGAIYCTREGRPPKKVMRFFPSIVKRWTGLKASKGEIV